MENIENKNIETPQVPEEDLIDIDYFKKVKLRVARIESARKVPGTDKLMELKLKLGEEERTIVAGIALHYSEDELPGKSIIIVANLKPAKLKGITSNGMLLAAKDESGLTLLTTEKEISSGSAIS